MRKLEKTLDRHAQLTDEIAEMRNQEVMPKHVVSGRNRRVRRKDAPRSHRFERRVEGQAARHVLAQELHDQERRVSFV